MRIASWIGARVRRIVAATAGALAVVTFAGCNDDAHMLAPGAPTLALQAVSPASGATGVSITMPMTMRFSAAVGSGMERYVLVHEGTVAGPVVAGRWSWSEDRRTLTFTPTTPLEARTTYVIHMGAGLRGMDGAPVDAATCLALGGRAVGAGMMGAAGGMMGAGWQSADGGYGMTFTFTTV